MGIRQTTEGFIANARATHGDRYDYSRVQLARYGSPVEILCPEHGTFWQVAKAHVAGHGCPKCGGVGRVTRDDFIARSREAHGDRYDYDQVEIANGKTPVTIICPDHGSFLQAPVSHMGGQGCSVCANRVPITEAVFLERALAVHGDRYSYARMVYAKYKDKVEIICPDHGSFWQSPYFHAQGAGCPTCAREQTASRGEQEVADWLTALGLRMTRNDRTVLDTMEIDIYLPDHRLGIEYNGAYWHSDEKLPSPRLHEVKAAKAQAAGVRLITIWDFDWDTRPDFIQEWLRHQLGLSRHPKIGARTCAVRVIEGQAATDFYHQTHIQGPAWRARVHYGLFHHEDLVACMSFGQGVSRRGKVGAGEWELIRLATRGVVRGAASKLFAAFLRDHAPQVIWSFSDRQYFNGQVYSVLGFQEDGRLPADYRVAHSASGRIWHKSAWQRQHIPARLAELGMAETFDPATDSRTERDMQALCRALRIMDAGKIRWKWTPFPSGKGRLEPG